MYSDKNKISAVVFDWAGTIVDFGSCAPMGALVRLFNAFNIDLSIAQARIPMGMAKRDHIQALLALPNVAQQWQTIYGKNSDEKDLDLLYQAFIPMNAEVIAD
ncbi:MAG: phosphonoacetaldehyde hydrolase, partial [Saezia sp.]